MEISESNKQKLINELKERCEETEQDILLNVKNILEKVTWLHLLFFLVLLS